MCKLPKTNLSPSTNTYTNDLLTSLTQSGTLDQSINYTYNNDFEVISTTYAGTTTNYSYDNDGLLTQSGDFTLTRDTENGFVTNISDGVLSVENRYNGYGELQTQTSQNFQLTLVRDEDSNSREKHHKEKSCKDTHKHSKHETINSKITHKEEIVVTYKDHKQKHKKDDHDKHSKHPHKPKVSKIEYDYTYDKNGRLTDVVKNHKNVEHYEYDANGNRIKAKVYGKTITATYDQEDGIDTYEDNTYTYDTDGQLNQKITNEGITTYSYNSQGNLTKVVTPTNTIEYILNPLGQRVAKKVGGTITEKYLWANLTTLLATLDANNNIIQRYNYTDSRVPTSMQQDGKTY
ncbi:hypothetical protein, partial [Sulfurimonas sp.]